MYVASSQLDFLLSSYLEMGQGHGLGNTLYILYMSLMEIVRILVLLDIISTAGFSRARRPDTILLAGANQLTWKNVGLSSDRNGWAEISEVSKMMEIFPDGFYLWKSTAQNLDSLHWSLIFRKSHFPLIPRIHIDTMQRAITSRSLGRIRPFSLQQRRFAHKVGKPSSKLWRSKVVAYFALAHTDYRNSSSVWKLGLRC